MVFVPLLAKRDELEKLVSEKCHVQRQLAPRHKGKCPMRLQNLQIATNAANCQTVGRPLTKARRDTAGAGIFAILPFFTWGQLLLKAKRLDKDMPLGK